MLSLFIVRGLCIVSVLLSCVLLLGLHRRFSFILYRQVVFVLLVFGILLLFVSAQLIAALSLFLVVRSLLVLLAVLVVVFEVRWALSWYADSYFQRDTYFSSRLFVSVTFLSFAILVFLYLSSRFFIRMGVI